ncbi:MAG: hypothetical protein COT74_08810 [Bdellovibrionales bacterium CG10_big_fil_rev_8_21_14_0_10_45_34]|nr:MAG: hypothetical protein COT74_08810 [Bdellovibrionales bacterium CG10_big_fil_rev_8_21_14_0_10_45_34]
MNSNKKVIIAVVLSAAVMLISQQRMEGFSEDYKKNHARLIPPPQNLDKFTPGYKLVLADSLWLRAIQDLDMCQGVNAIGDLKAISKNRCSQGWVYQMIDVITDLDPRYRIVYSVGAITLSVILSDVVGADRIYAKAIYHFPKDWGLPYRYAYHLLEETYDPVKAARMLTMAAENGAPDWTRMLAAKLLSENHRIAYSFTVLGDLATNYPEFAANDRFKERFLMICKRAREAGITLPNNHPRGLECPR